MEKRTKEIEDIAKLDIYRDKKCGIPEVILAEGKEPKWVVKLLMGMAKATGIAIASRVDKECFEAIKRKRLKNFRLRHYATVLFTGTGGS
ncbi:MAG: hypothetical protein Q8R05_02385 [Candidatus Omnitrophota bacterium]|nr:hypothetical protein [Candidatus Omnitrophota bacterium]